MVRKHVRLLLPKTVLFFLLLLLLFPVPKVSAQFSDAISMNLGLKIELGTVNLNEEHIVLNNSLEFQTENSNALTNVAEVTLKNEGTLNSKLAYKVYLSDEGGQPLPQETIENIVIQLSGMDGQIHYTPQLIGSNLVSDYQWLINSETQEPLLLSRDNNIKIKLSASLKKPFIKEESIKINVDFLLLPDNTQAPEEQLFSAVKTFSQTINIVPQKDNSEITWPSQDKFIPQDNNKFSSYIDLANIIGETHSLESENSQIENLNEMVLYLQFPKNEPITIKTKQGNQITEVDAFVLEDMKVNTPFKIKDIERVEKYNGYKIYLQVDEQWKTQSKVYNSYPYGSLNFNFNMSVYRSKLSFPAYKQWYGYYQFTSQKLVNRVILNSDGIKRDINTLEKITLNNKVTTLSFVTPDMSVESSWYALVNPYKFKDEIIQVNIFPEQPEKITAEVVEGKIQIKALKPLKIINLQKGTKILIQIKGNTGNEIKIVREIVIGKPSTMNLKMNETMIDEKRSVSSEKEDAEKKDSVLESDLIENLEEKKLESSKLESTPSSQITTEQQLSQEEVIEEEMPSTEEEDTTIETAGEKPADSPEDILGTNSSGEITENPSVTKEEEHPPLILEEDAIK